MPIFLTSRKRGTFSTNDGPQYDYEVLEMTTEYQRYSTTFTSEIDPDSTDRIIHFLLAVGTDTDSIYLDDIVMESITPAREEPMTFYVHPDGSDDNDGLELSAEGAFQTMRYGLSQLIPGDSLLVADGVYAENNLRILGVRGDEDRVTIVHSINPWGAKIEGDIVFNINLQIENSTHIKVEGFEIYGTGRSSETNKATGLQIFRSDYVTVENNFVHDCGCNGISGRESDYMTVRRNVTRDNARYSEFNCSGISIYQPRMLDQEPGTHILVAENVSFENEVRLGFSPLGFSVPTDGNGIILDEFNNTQSFSGQPNTTPPYVAETVVENNLVFSNGGAGIKTFEVENVIIRNNTSYHNSFVLNDFTTNAGEIVLQVLGGVAEVYNNLMVSEFGFQTQAFTSQTESGGEVILSNNLAVGNIVFNGDDPELMDNQFVTEDRQSYPQFAQARDSVFFQDFTFTSVDDFKQFFGLRAESPAVNAGANALAPATDLNGVARPVGEVVDIGAYEGSVEGVGELPDDERLTGFAVSAPTPLNVDGVKDGLYTAISRQITKVIDGTIADRADLSATWTAAYTDASLYLLVEVTDDSLSGGGDSTQLDDSVELYFDANNAAGDTPDADDRRFIVDRDGEITNLTDGVTTAAVATAIDTDDGYAVEVAIPWDLLGIVPRDSLQLGFDVQINDSDGTGRQGKLAWAAKQDSAALKPSLLGILELREVPAPPVIAGVRDSITVDGMADDAYDKADRYDMLNMVQPGIESEEDFSAEWRSVYDTGGIYFLVTVVDDILVNDSDNWYEDDGVEIYIDARNEKSTDYDENDHQLVIEYMGDSIYDTKNNLGPGALSAVMDTDSGYIAEAFIPWSALGIDPAAGYFIGLDVHGIDDDNGGGGNDGKLAWFTELDESFKNPRLFGTAVLGELETSSTRRQLVVGDWLSVAPNPSRQFIHYRLDGHRSGVLSLHDINGRLVMQREVEGRGGVLPVGTLSTGVYLLTVYDGNEWSRLRVVVNW